MSETPTTIMIVDDDIPLRTAFSRALERVGYEVVAATGSPEVVDMVADLGPAMVLLDNHMPGTSGIDLIRMIRQRWSAGELPLVLISGSSIQGEIDEAVEAGANDFKRKPVELAELIATVEGVIEPSQRPRSTTEGIAS